MYPYLVTLIKNNWNHSKEFKEIYLLQCEYPLDSFLIKYDTPHETGQFTKRALHEGDGASPFYP